MYLFLLPILLLFIILYLINSPKIKIERFDNSNIKIIHKTFNAFKFDDYSAYQNNKEFLKSNGIWNLHQKNIYVTVNNKKIPIIDTNNIYTFQTINGYKVKLTYQNNDVCGDIIINNHTDEFKCCHNNNGYTFKRSNQIIAKINKIKNEEYTLEMMKDTEYRDVYIICFIIFQQTQKELEISLDKIL